MTTGEQIPVLQYQPPSRDYLVAMISEMRDASNRAQQHFLEYHNAKARIEADIRGEGLGLGYTEETMRRMYEDRAATGTRWIVDQYTYWREKAMWHAACLTAENLTFDVLGEGRPEWTDDQPIEHPETADDTLEDEVGTTLVMPVVPEIEARPAKKGKRHANGAGRVDEDLEPSGSQA